MVEVKSEEEIKKLSRTHRILHICGVYVEGMSLKKKLPDGRKIELIISKCDECKGKILFTKGSPFEGGERMCTRCAMKKIKENPDEEILTVVREADKELFETCEKRMIEEELKKKLMIGM